jgi:hypothetical protein
MQPDQRKTLFLAAAIAIFAFWPKIGPIVQPYIDKITDTVVVSKNPFSVAELRVLVVYPTESTPSRDLNSFIGSVEVRQLVEAAGGEFKALDNETKFLGDNQKEYKEVIEANAATPMPYIAIGKGSSGKVEAFTTFDAAKALVQSYL